MLSIANKVNCSTACREKELWLDLFADLAVMPAGRPTAFRSAI